MQSWTDAQNAATRRALDRVPGRAALEQRLWQLYEIGSVGVPVSRAIAPGPAATRRYFYTRRDGKQNQPVLYVRDGAGGADRPLVDVNADRADGTRALDWWFPSDDGALVAYGVSDDGSEESVLRVRDVATGRDRADEIARTRACSVAWTPDGRGFYYTRYPAPGEVPAGEVKYHRSVYHHRLGEDPDQGSQAVRRRPRHDGLAGRRPVARRPLAGDHRQPGLVEERGAPARHAQARVGAPSPSPSAKTPSSTSSRCWTIA